MARYQLRRPTPIRVLPRRVRRQEPAPSGSAAPEAEEEEPEVEGAEEEGPESPDSPFSSPSTVGALSEGEDSPSPTEGAFPPVAEGAEPESDDEEESSTVSAAPEATAPPEAPPAASSVAPPPGEQPPPPPPPPPPAQSSLSPAIPTPEASPPPTESPTEAAPASTSTPFIATPAIPPSSPTSSSTRVPPLAQVTGGGDSSSDTAGSSLTTTVATDVPSQVSSSITTSVTQTPAQPELAGDGQDSDNNDGSKVGSDSGPPARVDKDNGALMPKGAEIALITFAVLGGIALLIGIFFCVKRRRRRRHEHSMRHAEDAFDPNNTGSLRAPETAFIAPTLGPNDNSSSHLTRSTNTSTLFGGGSHYQRPETVSTDRNAQSRIPPTPNPFADPPLNKAFDVLRGRPRSTTLTDRGSWIKNPFKDPESDRFDPFGEMQERARMERVKYMETLKREKEFEEKERMGLMVGVGVGADGRKGSGVTVEGLGVLDRSGDAYRR